jgi:hypothetical protein
MKTLVKKIDSILKKEIEEFYADLIWIRRGIIPASKKFIISNPLFFVGILIGVILHLI